MKLSGTFEITMDPATDDEFDAGRMSLRKSYSGDLTGSGQGQMLSKRTAVAGSAAYVAIEHFEGEVGGKRGGFSLVHLGKMNNGESSLAVDIIPDSGTGELTGISGNMGIDIVDGVHHYTLDASL